MSAQTPPRLDELLKERSARRGPCWTPNSEPEVLIQRGSHSNILETDLHDLADVAAEFGVDLS